MVISALPARTSQAPARPWATPARRHFLELVRGECGGLAPALERSALHLASLPYGLAVYVRNWLYDLRCRRAARAGVPVVSVGNLTVGGTGKTPCVEYVAAYYRGRGLRVAILSRGYGGGQGGNDEALLLGENLPGVPHLQGADRAELARRAVDEHASQVLVLDDGFQHRRLARDLDLVLVDATCPWGHGYLLPRGLLREPPGSLHRAGAVLVTRCDQVDRVGRAELVQTIHGLAPHAAVVETSHEAVECRAADGSAAPLEALRAGPVAAFCGVGNPGAFRRTLADLGVEVCAWRTFPDHHAYSPEDVDDLDGWVRSQGAAVAVATTQKDLVKLRLPRLGRRPLRCVRVRLRVDAGRDALHALLDAAVVRERPVIPRGEGPAP